MLELAGKDIKKLKLLCTKSLEILEGIKKTEIKLLELKTIISEVKNTLDGMNGKLDIAEEKISELDISIGTIQNEMEEKKNMSELWNNFK